MTVKRPTLSMLYELALDVPPEGPIRELSGRVVPYNVRTNRGFYAEGVRPGALDKSIAELGAGGVPLVFMSHEDQAWPVGTSIAFESKPDALYGRWRLDTGPEATRAGQLVRDGFLSGLSVGAEAIRNEWEYVAEGQWSPDLGIEHMDTLWRVEARLVHVALVTTQAFAQAKVLAIAAADRDPEIRAERARRRPSLQAWRAELDTLRTGSPRA
jgi:HK97 family phage prohead protease